MVYAGSTTTIKLAMPTQQFKLQYAVLSSSCSSSSYSDITGTSPISFYDNPTPANNSSISSTANDPTDTGQSVSPQTYNESKYFYNSSALDPTTDGEWDFSLYDNGAPAGAVYCIRGVEADGTVFATYTNYPMITTFSSGGPAIPTTDQLLRGGQWFSGGIKQAYYWSN
jgi:hypothetical protein